MSKRKIAVLLLLSSAYVLQVGCPLGLPRLGMSINSLLSLFGASTAS